MAEEVIIRKITVSDASHFLALRYALDEETSFLMLEKGERNTTLEQQTQVLERITSSDRDCLLVLDNGAALVGYLAAKGGDYQRNRHSAYVTMGIRQTYCGQGWGKKMFAALIEWARKAGITRLELTVMAHNEHAIRLYERVGFVKEGIKRNSLRVDRKYVDEYYMGLIID